MVFTVDRFKYFFNKYIHRGNKMRIEEARKYHNKVLSLISRLDASIERMKERDKFLYEKILDIRALGDYQRASMYERELLLIRDITRRLMIIQEVLIKIASMLESVSTEEDINTIIELLEATKKQSRDILPEIVLELNEIEEELTKILNVKLNG